MWAINPSVILTQKMDFGGFKTNVRLYIAGAIYQNGKNSPPRGVSPSPLSAMSVISILTKVQHHHGIVRTRTYAREEITDITDTTDFHHAEFRWKFCDPARKFAPSGAPERPAREA
jgi:hypothetical protein